MTTSKIVLVTLALLLSVGASTRLSAANVDIQKDDFDARFNQIAFSNHLKAHLLNGWTDGGPACRNDNYPPGSPNGQCAYQAFGRLHLYANYSIETGNIRNIHVISEPQMDSSAFFDTLVTTIALIAPQLSKEERETTANEMFGQVMQLTSPKVHRLNEFWWSASSSRPTAISFNWRP